MLEDEELEVIAGDGSEIDVSPVYNHLNTAKAKTKEEDEKKNIIIPKTKEEKEQEQNRKDNLEDE